MKKIATLSFITATLIMADNGNLSQPLDTLTSIENNSSEMFEPSMLMQTRYTYDKREGEPSQNDVGVRRIELGLRANVNEWVSGNFLYIFEDIGKDGEINLLEEAYIRIGNSEETPFYLQAGKMLLPFGKFDFYTAREPYTIDFAETIKNAVLVGYEQNGLNLNAYAFMDKDDLGSNELDYFGATLAYERSISEVALSSQLSYISDIRKAGGFSDALSGLGVSGEKTAAYGVALTANMGQLGVIGEYITAGDDIAGPNTQASILNLEAAYEFPFATTALSYIKTDEAEFAGLPENVTSFTLSREIYQYTTLALEYALIEGYDGIKQDSAVLQVAFSF
ncbi:MAG: LbtU family siderophore porin [Sulfurimonas sp.]